jgi:hypothetical protein
MVIRILDYISQVDSYRDGQRIYDLIAAPLANGEDVVLSFEGVDAVPSSFVNASILRVAEILPVSAVKAHLKIVDSTRQINDLVRSRMRFLEQSRGPAVARSS